MDVLVELIRLGRWPLPGTGVRREYNPMRAGFQRSGRPGGVVDRTGNRDSYPPERRMAVAVNESGAHGITGPRHLALNHVGSGFYPPRKGLHECRRLHLSERAAR